MVFSEQNMNGRTSLRESETIALIRKAYYLLKPLLPKRLLMRLRRMLIRQQIQAFQDSWPIFAPAAKAPENWAGWPDGKRFALVLTHDVDTGPGNDKVPELVKLELSLGFKSTFFFVPEDYKEPDRHHDLLRRNGFEIGVHGLQHDGRLHQSKKIFLAKAARINMYIQRWGAAGFRAPSMHHNLAWHHHLNILYDASTYDTDPFEPQGGGVATIFPFTVTDQETGHSYVELPYSLPQDHLLFVLMREKAPDIWKRKLDWIVSNGGMAHVISHPDYMTFNGGRCGLHTYSASLYADFLNYIRETYGGQYWLTTAGEVASFWKAQANPGTVARATGEWTTAQERPPRSCMLVFSYYPGDVRVRREAESLQNSGIQVDVICLRAPGQHPQEAFNGVNVYRLPMQRSRKGRFHYMLEYIVFFLLGCAKITRLYLQKKHDVMHIHNMPDFLVFCTLIPRLGGAKIILDLHDPTPEVYMAKYFLREGHPIIRVLKFIERICIRFADLVITPNMSFKNLFTARSCRQEKVHIIMNSPDENIFSNNNFAEDNVSVSNKEHFTIMFHGTIVERHGLDIALEALVLLRKKMPNIRFKVYGDGDFVERFLTLREEYALQEMVTYHGAVMLETIVEKIRTIDVGLIPNKQSAFTDINFPTRIFEYLCMHKPTIAPRTQGILDYFKDDEIFFFEPGNPQDLSETIFEIYNNPEMVKEKIGRGRAVYLRHTWQGEQVRLVKLVRDLIAR
jgi:glycosyltransferase involved in cell wall biosynthesis/peptidoglycan/xylan/chitin deacetylase (PgdA/CDA1 family)